MNKEIRTWVILIAAAIAVTAGWLVLTAYQPHSDVVKIEMRELGPSTGGTGI